MKETSEICANIYDPWWVASQLPKALGHREQQLIERLQREEARSRRWKALAKLYFQELAFADEAISLLGDDD